MLHAFMKYHESQIFSKIIFVSTLFLADNWRMNLIYVAIQYDQRTNHIQINVQIKMNYI